MTGRHDAKPLLVRCPSCRSIDLGAWASERFRVADPVPPDEQDSPPQQ